MAMKFGTAISRMKSGYNVTRTGWESGVLFPVIYIKKDKIWYEENTNSEPKLWEPTHEDILAEDWVISF